MNSFNEFFAFVHVQDPQVMKFSVNHFSISIKGIP